MKYAKFAAIGLMALLLVSLPVSMLMASTQPAQAAADEGMKVQNVLPLPSELDNPGSDVLKPNEFTPDGYVQPQYDPFNNKFAPSYDFEEKVDIAIANGNTPPMANFVVRTDNELADTNSGTTATSFVFDAHSSSDNETKSGNLQVRWDFESDGKVDTFFSRGKSVKHKFVQPGAYTVTVQVLDRGGLTDAISRKVTVVENTEPTAFFSYTPVSGTESQIFRFDTSKSSDSQYKKQFIEYRFDWNGDGQWDTPYNKKTIWQHRFGAAGTFHVVMEAKDFEGALNVTDAYIDVFENTAPTASFSIDSKTVKTLTGGQTVMYFFDASASSDSESDGKLQYRWDTDYTGENDINFTTQWRSSPKFSGSYNFAGEKTVRLQVKDVDGAVSNAFATVFVE
ncbi:PKD domain-containing protein [Patescibacteria group bacterium]|nr:PKD domain-containing protein [Patescibacteria group bacterium]MBU1703155.1 PKD domain-containing protein [Patescibacteria group bacterium]MBU1953721.1 PKD domain-containing protein [Patescibacteria group bacterium]